MVRMLKQNTAAAADGQPQSKRIAENRQEGSISKQLALHLIFAIWPANAESGRLRRAGSVGVSFLRPYPAPARFWHIRPGCGICFRRRRSAVVARGGLPRSPE